MRFYVCLAGNGWHGALAKVTRVSSGVLLQLKNLKITLHLLHKDKIDNFSSKQSFEEKSLKHYDDEIFCTDTLFEASSCAC